MRDIPKNHDEVWLLDGMGGVRSSYMDCLDGRTSAKQKYESGYLFEYKEDAMRLSHLVSELALKFKKTLDSEM